MLALEVKVCVILQFTEDAGIRLRNLSDIWNFTSRCFLASSPYGVVVPTTKLQLVANDCIEVNSSYRFFGTWSRILDHTPFARINHWIKFDGGAGEQHLERGRSPGTCSKYKLVTINNRSLVIATNDIHRESPVVIGQFGGDSLCIHSEFKPIKRTFSMKPKTESDRISRRG